jgi:hypothetical protein
MDEHCNQVATEYRQLLRPDNQSFIDCSLDQLVSTIRSCQPTHHQCEALNEFDARYLRLELSDPYWRATCHNGAT